MKLKLCLLKKFWIDTVEKMTNEQFLIGFTIFLSVAWILALLAWGAVGVFMIGNFLEQIEKENKKDK